MSLIVEAVELVGARRAGWHRHTWHAHSGDDRWRCACGAWVHELVTAAKKVIALPPAAAA